MSNTFPPNGYVEVESAVEGVVVFAPAPEHDEKHQEIVSFSCPNCGADRAYSAADGSLRCTSCGYVEAIKAQIVGRGAQEFEFTIDTLEHAAHGWGIERKELQCQNCGAVTTIPDDSLTFVCPFCHSAKVIQRKAPQDLLRPRFLIPLKVEVETCRQATRAWLKSSWMTPGDLGGEAILDNFLPLYVPYWTFDAKTSAFWKAQVGKTVTTGTGRNRRTRTVWRWESGRVNLDIDDLLVSGTTHVSEVLLKQAANFATDDLIPYDAKFLAGIHAQAYERDLETAWEMGREEMRERTKTACINQASSKKIRNFTMNMDFADEAWRYVLVPVYVSAYRYGEQTFQVLVNGQTSKVSGQRPVAWYKVIFAVALALLPGMIGLLIGLFGYVTNAEFAKFIGFVGFIVFAAALTWSGATIQQGMAMDDV